MALSITSDTSKEQGALHEYPFRGGMGEGLLCNTRIFVERPHHTRTSPPTAMRVQA